MVKNNLPNLLNPVEDDEAIALTHYLNFLQDQGKIILFSHITNETYTRSWAAGKKRKSMGLRPGVPDFLILTKTKILFLELKRKKGGKLSLEQKHWLEELAKRGATVDTCLGFDHAKQFVDSAIDSHDNS